MVVDDGCQKWMARERHAMDGHVAGTWERPFCCRLLIAESVARRAEAKREARMMATME